MSDSNTPQPATLEVTNPHLPVDAGLSGLGLVMSLAGTVFLAIMCGAAALLLVSLMLAGGNLRGAGTVILLSLLAITASIVRSAMHRIAGQRLLYSGPGTPRTAVRNYLIWAAIQTGLILVALASQGAPGKVTVCLVAMLAAWPVALATMLAGRRFAQLLDQPTVPVGDDRGFEGASILMLVFGISGLLFAVVMGGGMIESLGMLFEHVPVMAVTMLAIAAMLGVRSALHLRAGVRGVRNSPHNPTADAAVKYADFGWLTSIVVGLAFIVMTLSIGHVNGVAFSSAVLTASFMVWALAAWPQIIKRYFSERQFSALIANSPESSGRSPDRGLTTLGWFLFAQAVMSLAMALPALVVAGGGDDDRHMHDPMIELVRSLQTGTTPWWSIGIAAAQLIAGLELIRMRPSHRLVATVYGAAAALVTIYIHRPILEAMLKGGLAGQGPEGMMSALVFGSVALALVVPAATVIFVNRRSPIAPARAIR